MLSRFAFLLVLILAGLFFAGCNEHAKQVQVLDGHALQIGAKKLHLYAIDVPELTHRCGHGPGEWRCGMVAREELTKLINGHKPECKPAERDAYNHAAAICFVGKIDLGEAMVRSGLARVDRHHPEVYAKAEAEARAAGRGLWAESGAAAASSAKPKASANR